MNHKNKENASVRPKIRHKNLEKLNGEPLEKRSIQFEDRDGIRRFYSALHIRFSHPMVFVKYTIPPINSLSDSGFIGENADKNYGIQSWIKNVNRYEEMLKTLIKLPHNRFWSTIIFEKSLQISLESYLSLAPRYHDLHNPMITDQMKIANKKVHILLLKFYLRLSTYNESNKSFISPNVFANMLYENCLFDIPKMIDIAVLYGNSQYQPFIKQMFSNLIDCQPLYLQDITKTCFNFCETLNIMEAKLGIGEHQNNGQFGSSKLKYISWPELQNIVLNLADISVSLRMFLLCVPRIADNYKRADIDRMILEIYNHVFPVLQKEIDSRFSSDKSNNHLLSIGIKRQILIARTNLILIFRDIIQILYIEKLFDDNIIAEEKLKIIDDFIETLSSAAYDKSFISDYCLKYPLETDIEYLTKYSSKTKLCDVDRARIDYFVNEIQTCIYSETSNIAPDLNASVDKTNEVKVNGYLDLNIEEAVSVNVELESQIQYVCDIMPDLGPGFVEKCLEHYNYDSEKVVEAILENTLPLQLRGLDRSLQRSHKLDVSPVDRSTLNEKNTQNSDTFATSIKNIPQVIEQRKNIYNDDEFDIFRNSKVDLNRIHIGKKDKKLTKLDDKTKQSIIILSKNMEMEEMESFAEYNDEYDDTYEDDTTIDLTTSDKLMDELVINQKSRDLVNGAHRSPDNN